MSGIWHSFPQQSIRKNFSICFFPSPGERTEASRGEAVYTKLRLGLHSCRAGDEAAVQVLSPTESCSVQFSELNTSESTQQCPLAFLELMFGQFYLENMMDKLSSQTYWFYRAETIKYSCFPTLYFVKLNKHILNYNTISDAVLFKCERNVCLWIKIKIWKNRKRENQ